MVVVYYIIIPLNINPKPDLKYLNYRILNGI